jgi:hypothetical protein
VSTPAGPCVSDLTKPHRRFLRRLTRPATQSHRIFKPSLCWDYGTLFSDMGYPMKTIATLLLMFSSSMVVVFVGCRSNKGTPALPTPTAPVNAKPSFVPPTAEQAYSLKDDCTRRGEAILREDEIGPVLTKDQVSRYNPTTNKCYVRLEVHAMNLREWGKYDNTTSLYDGQTKELLAYVMVRPGGAKAYLGFGCAN